MMASFIPICLTGCLILMMAMLSIGAETELDQKLRDTQSDAGPYRDAYKSESVDRRARAVSQTARGIAAAQKLLAGAERVKTLSKQYRSYRKDGNYESALADFYSVEPALRKKNPNRPIVYYRYSRHGNRYKYPLTGTVGDIHLILLQNGDAFSRGSPVLEVRAALDELYDRIVYKTAGN